MCLNSRRHSGTLDVKIQTLRGGEGNDKDLRLEVGTELDSARRPARRRRLAWSPRTYVLTDNACREHWQCPPVAGCGPTPLRRRRQGGSGRTGPSPWVTRPAGPCLHRVVAAELRSREASDLLTPKGSRGAENKEGAFRRVAPCERARTRLRRGGAGVDGWPTIV